MMQQRTFGQPAAAATPAVTVVINKKTLQALAPLPDTAIQLLGLLDDPNVSLRKVADVAVRDVGISAAMLRVANSAVFGMRGRIGSVSDALRVIGIAQVRLLILASGFSRMGQKALPLYGLDTGVFTRHSELVAHLTMCAAHDIRCPNLGLAYSAGLLHDIGKIVLNGAAQQQEVAVGPLNADAMKQRYPTLCAAEQAIFGCTHTSVGGQLAESWLLPVEITESITQHHDDWPAIRQNTLAFCVALADAMACELDPAYRSYGAVAPELAENSLIDPEKLRSMGEEFLKSHKNVA